MKVSLYNQVLFTAVNLLTILPAMFQTGCRFVPNLSADLCQWCTATPQRCYCSGCLFLYASVLIMIKITAKEPKNSHLQKLLANSTV